VIVRLLLVAATLAGCGSPGVATPPPTLCPPWPEPVANIDRDQMRPQLQPALVEVNKQPEFFADGFLTDDDGPWRWVVNVVAGETFEASRCRIQQLLPDGAPVVFRPVQHSQAELVRINLDLSNVIRMGGPVHGWGLNTIENRVDVFAHEPVPGLEDVLRDRYGDVVVVVMEPKPEPI
jgi:hypothetical protein